LRGSSVNLAIGFVTQRTLAREPEATVQEDR